MSNSLLLRILCSILETAFYIFTLPVYLRQLSATSLEVGVFYALDWLSSGVSILLGGYLITRVGIKKILIMSSLVWLPMPLALAFASNWTQVVLPTILYGTYLGFSAVCFYLIKGTVKGGRMLAFGLWSSSQSLSYIISPLIGGIIASTISKQTVFLLAFVFYSLSILPLFLVKGLHQKGEEDLPAEKAQMFPKMAQKFFCCR